MGLILDSSVVIAAEWRGDTVEHLLARIIATTGDQEAALSAVGLTELIHGIYRAPTQSIRQRRELFLNELLSDLTVYPYTRETAMLAEDLMANSRLLEWSSRLQTCSSELPHWR